MNPMRRATWVAIAVWLIADVAAGDDRINPKAIDGGRLATSQPVASLLWVGETGTLHAGTLTGPVVRWHLLGGKDGPVDVIALTNEPVTPVTLTLGGAGHTRMAGGLTRQPTITLLPGANIGTVASSNMVLGADPHPTRPLLAVRQVDGVQVHQGDPLAPVKSFLGGMFDLVSWVDASALPTWLAASVRGGPIRFWQEGKWADPPLEVHPPPVPPGTAGGAWNPLAIRSAPSASTGLWLLTGDDRGGLRRWKAPVGSEAKTIAAADVSTFSRDGSALIEHAGTQLILRHPFGAADVPAPTRATPPTSLQHGRVGIADIAVVAWPNREVEQYDFSGPAIKLQPNTGPMDEVRALAVRGDGNQVAGAVGGQGVVFFARAAVPAPAAPAATDPKEDPALVGLFYVPNANFLVAIGTGASLYDASQRTLLATPTTISLADSGDRVTACDLLFPSNTSDPIRLLVGTERGRLELWKITIGRASLGLTRLGQSRATGQPVRRVTLGDDLALSASDLGTVLWSLATEIEPIERFHPSGTTSAMALADGPAVLYRHVTEAVRRPVSAARAIRCGDRPLTQIVATAAGLLFAVDDAGRIITVEPSSSTVSAQLNPAPVADSVLALSPDGKTLLVGFTRGGKGIVQRWGVDGDKLVGPPDEFEQPSPEITAIQFGTDLDAIFVGHRDGRLTRFGLEAPAGESVSLMTRLRLDGGEGGVVDLARLPSSPLLVTDGKGRLSVRQEQGQPGPTLRFPSQALPYPAPWYAVALSPDRQTVAMVNAEGEAWAADWPFPRPLKLFQVDTEALPIRPASGVARVSTAPLYAAGWIGPIGGPPTLVIAGADGNLWFARNGGWTPNPAAKDTARKVWALAAHPITGALAVGFGSAGQAGDEDAWLAVRSDPADPATERKCRGHVAAIRALAFSDDGSILASADRSGLVLFWDAASFKPGGDLLPAGRFTLAPVAVTSLAWINTPTAKLLAVGTESNVVRLLHVAP